MLNIRLCFKYKNKHTSIWLELYISDVTKQRKANNQNKSIEKSNPYKNNQSEGKKWQTTVKNLKGQKNRKCHFQSEKKTTRIELIMQLTFVNSEYFILYEFRGG